MTLTNEQYERVGRYLDGESLELSDAERAVAEQLRRDEAHLGDMLAEAMPADMLDGIGSVALLAEIRRDEAALAGLLDARVPPGTFQHVHRRVVASLARPQRTFWRIGVAASAVAVAAAIVLAVVLSPFGPGPSTVADPVAGTYEPAVPVEILSASVEVSEDATVELLALEIDEYEADLIASAPSAALDMGIDQVERAVQTLWLDMEPTLE